MNAFLKRIRDPECWYWLVGPAALIWILLRSGANPKRLNYPCQRAAMPIAVTWLLAMIGFVTGSILLRRFIRYSGIILAAAGLVWFVISVPGLLRSAPASVSSLPVWDADSLVSQVFVLDSIPPTAGSLAAGNASVPDEYLPDPAIDTLLMIMAARDVYLHRTAEHPQGIVGADNIVIIKGNYQWTSWNTTSTDRVKGLIWRILNHPDGFTGEIVVCDNVQDIGTGINHNDNNSEDTEQSILDVVNTFSAKGYPVYQMDWAFLYNMVASEYADGDLADGYVFEEDSKISYPKFITPSFNHFVSLRYGIWDTLTATYDPSRLCIIDFPVLKAHSWAGATVAIKNWIGVLTTAYAEQRYGGFDPMHDNYFFGPYALVARVMAVTYPRLSIVDAAWTTTRGPINLTAVVNTKILMASTDPTAVSWYAAKFVLTPIADYPYNTNPDQSGGDYHDNLMYWNQFLRDSAGYPCTIDSTEMSIFSREIYQDTDGDGVVDRFDNCVDSANASQQNSDDDSFGDVCDNCPHADNEDQLNSDADTLGNVCDNCPNTTNNDQADSDGDGIGDACDFVCGDANGDGTINIADAVYIISYIFKGGPAPDPLCVADANGDGTVNISDAVYLVSYIFKGGPPPDPDCCP